MMNEPDSPASFDSNQDLDRVLADFLNRQEQNLSWDERKTIFISGITVAEKLDDFIRHLDPTGELPRFEALMYRQLRQMERHYR